MAEDSERRFLAVMDKLFHAPPKPKVKPSTTTTTTASSSRGTKRPHMLSALAAPELKSRRPGAEELRNTSGTAAQAPLCRPWDRADLLKRLATFKSMTWFAKPEVVSAVRCARSGWVNVDVDIIACESCGARLLFSTPSSWAQQQVEKAALVFSLKLNNGHKDWIVQFDPPDEPKEYIHRVGRTARGEGAKGHALLFLLPEEMKFISYLKAAKVPVKEYEFDPKKLKNVQSQLEKMVANNYSLNKEAKEAYRSYMLAYNSHSMKEIFNVHRLDVQAVAASFCFSCPPKVHLNIDSSASKFKNKRRKVEGSRNGFNEKNPYGRKGGDGNKKL